MRQTVHLVIARLGWRQTIKGAVIFGLIAGLMLPLQGYAYAKGYRSPRERQQFTSTLRSTPALGIMYGETADLAGNTVRGYMIYRTLTFLALVGAVWGLMATTKLLRGNEEDGRWEVILAGSASRRQATFDILLGLVGALLASALVCGLCIGLTTRGPEFNLPLADIWLVVMALYAPAAVFVSLGALVSQLAISRRRALAYGLTPLVLLYLARALANTLDGWYWLKYLTPFGWVDRLSPVVTPRPVWLLAFGVTGLGITSLSLWLVGRRDLATGLWHESDHRKSRFYWLATEWQFTLRRNLAVYSIWAFCIAGVAALMTAIASLAVKATAQSAQLNQVLTKLTGGSADSIKLAFIGSAGLMVSFGLLMVAVQGWSDTYRQESQQQADFALVGPQSRPVWLLNHLLAITTTIALISLLTSSLVWVLATRQHLPVGWGTMLTGSLQSFGAVLFILGGGALIYGLWPRLTVPVLYSLLLWSFIVDIITSVAKLPPLVKSASLFHYISLVPAAKADWLAFYWLSGLGVAFLLLGMWLFNRRDIETA